MKINGGTKMEPNTILKDQIVESENSGIQIGVFISRLELVPGET